MIRTSLMGSALLLCLGLGLAGYSLWRYADALHERSERQAQLSATIALVERLRSDADQLRLYEDAYLTLQRQGVTGEFDKSRVIDQFESALQNQPVPVRGFKLKVRTPVLAGHAARLGRFSLYRYELTFDAQPLHEGRFIELMQRVRAALSGLSTLESCQLKRIQQVGFVQTLEQADQPRLDANCSVYWYEFGESAVPVNHGAAPAMN